MLRFANVVLYVYMSEIQKSPNKSKRALVAGLALGAVAGGGMVEAAHRVLSAPEIQPASSAEAFPQWIERDELMNLIDKFREEKLAGATEVASFKIEGPNTTIFETGLESIQVFLGEDDYNANSEVIKATLLESGKTANTDQPEAPYVTHPGQVYGLYQVDLNGDGFQEYVASLKLPGENIEAENQLVPGESAILNVPEGSDNIGATEYIAKDSLKNDTN
jgi:hypothetical protein